jgi:hypothetical protein
MSRQFCTVTLLALLVGGGFVVSRVWGPRPAWSGMEADASAANDGTTLKRAAPEFPKGAEWVQGGPLKLADLRGRVTVVHFWTNG